MSGFLFDTCVVRNWFAKNTAITARVAALPGASPLYISSITLGEIEYGHTNVAATDLAKQAQFRKWMRETFEVPALEITASTGREYAKFRRQLFAKFKKVSKYTENYEDHLGTKIGIDINDLWLVAQACERNLTFVSNDKMSKIKDVVGTEVRIDLWPES